MCTDSQQAVITRLIADVPSRQHHIIMDLVLRNQIKSAEAVAEEFSKIAALQASAMQAFQIAQEETQQAVEHHAQASRNFVVARADIVKLQEALAVSQHDYQRLSEMNAAFQERVIQMETNAIQMEAEREELYGFLAAASDALDAAEVAATLAVTLVEAA
ncbi:hypothetical protein ATI02_5978 [Pseudomonas baetica]|uniref:Uncharacterized protein n=1 Tax=Pseudomonas baetica TaxID=674054 RepID=A0ABX4Q7W1_9PSED|nr:hypothetical protein [Pseudomonas baetica]PKA72877.1 hypothetical protein ATI02_5978 [Pseudomonas baetica]PTC19030.1 hypothetical protein C0J26_11355 [Pseudomonas baetica]